MLKEFKRIMRQDRTYASMLPDRIFGYKNDRDEFIRWTVYKLKRAVKAILIATIPTLILYTVMLIGGLIPHNPYSVTLHVATLIFVFIIVTAEIILSINALIQILRIFQKNPIKSVTQTYRKLTTKDRIKRLFGMY